MGNERKNNRQREKKKLSAEGDLAVRVVHVARPPLQPWSDCRNE